MLKNRTELLRIGHWVYERYSFKSEILGQEFHFGLFRSEALTKITTSIYVFHGGGADDRQAVQAGLLPLLAADLSSRQREDVQFVFPFIGNSFLHDPPGAKSKSFSDYFLHEIMSFGGENISPENQLLCGWSMGGQAAMNMFLRYPNRFGGVGAHFPTLVKFDYNDMKESAEYAKRMNVSELMMSTLVTEFRKEFADLKDFSSHDPLKLAQRAEPPELRGKKIYFDVGSKDEFGLSEGALALHEILTKKNIVHQLELVPGGKHDGAFIHAQVLKMLGYLLGNSV